MLRELIVNADDCNLTNGVTRAILECHEKGIVSSTTWMVTQPADQEMIRRVADSGLGVGVHLNVTSGQPVSNPREVSSLVTEGGVFKKKNDYLQKAPALGDLVKEYGKQIELFKKCFGRLPTHLDTHHQMHDEPVFMQAVTHVAKENKIPVRRSALMAVADFKKKYSGLLTTQILLGDLGAHVFWSAEKLEKALSVLLPGSAEVMCHPGVWDAELQKVTSMTVAREKEYALFSSPHLKKVLERFKIRLIHFGELRDKG